MDYIGFIKDTGDESFHYFPSVTESDIKKAETMLGVELSNNKQYNQFLLQCGSLINADSILLGLFPEADMHERGTFVGETLYMRRTYRLDNVFSVLEFHEDENVYALNMNNGHVYSIDITADNKLSKPEKVSESFEEHFIDFVDGLRE